MFQLHIVIKSLPSIGCSVFFFFFLSTQGCSGQFLRGPTNPLRPGRGGPTPHRRRKPRNSNPGCQVSGHTLKRGSTPSELPRGGSVMCYSKLGEDTTHLHISTKELLMSQVAKSMISFELGGINPLRNGM